MGRFGRDRTRLNTSDIEWTAVRSAKLMKHPDDLPDVILVARDWEDFLLDFKKRPGRNRIVRGYRLLLRQVRWNGIAWIPAGRHGSSADSCLAGAALALVPPYRIPASRDLLFTEEPARSSARNSQDSGHTGGATVRP